MNNEELAWITGCLPKQMVYSYFRDRYALDLLEAYVGDGRKISEIKRSKYAKVLNRQAVKAIIARCGNGVLRREDIRNYWDDATYYLRLTLGEWGEHCTRKNSLNIWEQVSRPQKNLVLQVNFDGQHDLVFFRSMGKEYRCLFRNMGHPVSEKLNTMGWSRMDVDLDGGEVLIEEVQTDWIREVRFQLRRAHITTDFEELKRKLILYYPVVAPYLKMWDEMILGATIWFIRNQLGINKIWYHSFESSKHYKMMDADFLPPRSVYQSLPEKFGFDRVNEIPEMIGSCEGLRKLVKCGKHLNFYKLEL